MKENNQLPVIFDHGYFLKTGENFGRGSTKMIIFLR